MSPTVITYLVYLALSLCLATWVGRTLFHNGRIFLVDVFGGNEELADSVNRLLVVGFYLINFGFISRYLKLAETVTDAQESIEALSVKVGAVLLVLGAMHFFNLYVLSVVRRRAAGRDIPPVEPDEVLPAGAVLQGAEA